MASWSVAHHRFHRTVVSGCGPRVLRTITSYAEQRERYVRSLQARHRDGFPARHREHEAILAAIQDGEPERAVTQMAQHLAGTALRLMKDCSPDHEPYAVPAAVAMVGAASAGRAGSGAAVAVVPTAIIRCSILTPRAVIRSSRAPTRARTGPGLIPRPGCGRPLFALRTRFGNARQCGDPDRWAHAPEEGRQTGCVVWPLVAGASDRIANGPDPGPGVAAMARSGPAARPGSSARRLPGRCGVLRCRSRRTVIGGLRARR